MEFKIINDKKRKRILEIHCFLPGRRAKLISYDRTYKKGWITLTSVTRIFDRIKGKEGIITKVHESVIDAVELEVEGDIRYWHFEDLELVPVKNIIHEEITFDPTSLDI